VTFSKGVGPARLPPKATPNRQVRAILPLPSFAKQRMVMKRVVFGELHKRRRTSRVDGFTHAAESPGSRPSAFLACGPRIYGNPAARPQCLWFEGDNEGGALNLSDVAHPVHLRSKKSLPPRDSVSSGLTRRFNSPPSSSKFDPPEFAVTRPYRPACREFVASSIEPVRNGVSATCLGSTAACHETRFPTCCNK
jgi:hypothetical protein